MTLRIKLETAQSVQTKNDQTSAENCFSLGFLLNCSSKRKIFKKFLNADREI